MASRRLSLKLIFLLTVILISVLTAYASHHIQAQRNQLLDTMILGAEQLSRDNTSTALRTMLADNCEAAYEIMQKIAKQQGIDRICLGNPEGRVMFSTHAPEINRMESRD